MDKNRIHRLTHDLQALALELGRTPTKHEFIASGKATEKELRDNSSDRPNHRGISYTNLVRLANLDQNKKNSTDTQRANKQEIRKKILDLIRIDQDEPEAEFPQDINRALIIGDLHAPYHHKDAIEFILALKKKYKFDYACSVGDEIDAHGLSFHDKDPDLLSAGYELEAAIEALQPLYKAFPSMDIAESNHGSLLYRKGKHHGIPRQLLKPYREAIEAPKGWRWNHELRLGFSDGSKAIVHHSFGNNVLNNSKRRASSLIQGHWHRLQGVQTWRNATASYFAAQTGCLIDPKALAYAYNKNDVERPLLGCIGIFAGIPRVLPLITNAKGRWTGFIP